MLGIRIGFGLMALVFLVLAGHQGLMALGVTGEGSVNPVAVWIATVGCLLAAVGTAYYAWKVR